MKLTKIQLQNIIKAEVRKALAEDTSNDGVFNEPESFYLQGATFNYKETKGESENGNAEAYYYLKLADKPIKLSELTKLFNENIKDMYEDAYLEIISAKDESVKFLLVIPQANW